MMPNGITPPGWRAVLLGSVSATEGTDVFIPLEEGVPEGSLMLARLDFIDYPTAEAIDQINQGLAGAGVAPWPGASYYAFIDYQTPSLYICWAKGFAWWPIIAGVLALTVLPPLVGSFLWLILPEEVKTMIETLITMGGMLLLMFVMMQFMKPLMASDKTKEIKETSK